MNKEPMPAAEAEIDTNAYEFAFHVLPTVAEGEVTAVVDAIKARIAAHGGTVTSEEAPARFELAYEIIKHLEGRNRKFTSAYFGWIRFTMSPEAAPSFTAEIEDMKELLRTMLIKLTKIEEANPFYFHEALATPKEETVTVPESEEANDETDAESADTETTAEEDVDSEDTE